VENISIACVVVNVPHGIFNNLITICVALKSKWSYELASRGYHPCSSWNHLYVATISQSLMEHSAKILGALSLIKITLVLTRNWDAPRCCHATLMWKLTRCWNVTLNTVYFHPRPQINSEKQWGRHQNQLHSLWAIRNQFLTTYPQLLMGRLSNMAHSWSKIKKEILLLTIKIDRIVILSVQ
jgi:hypothetical protein